MSWQSFLASVTGSVLVSYDENGNLLKTSDSKNAGLVVAKGGELNNYLTAQTTTGDSASFGISLYPAWQAFLTGTSGALSATVEIYASNDDAHWTLVGTMLLSVASWSGASDDDVAKLIPVSFGSWKITKATIPAGGITGTGAAVTVIGG